MVDTAADTADTVADIATATKALSPLEFRVVDLAKGPAAGGSEIFSKIHDIQPEFSVLTQVFPEPIAARFFEASRSPRSHGLQWALLFRLSSAI